MLENHNQKQTIKALFQMLLDADGNTKHTFNQEFRQRYTIEDIQQLNKQYTTPRQAQLTITN